MDQSRRRAPARQEFDRFVTAAADGLLRAAYLITWDLADAEDLVQECLLKVARRWPRIRKMDHPTAYARTVLVHLALDEGKGRSRRRAELSPSAVGVLDEREDNDAVRIIGRVEANADLLGALAQLPPRQRVVLVLRYFEDMSEAEVAAAMECSIGTVKSTTSRALDRLRAAIELDSPGASALPTDGRSTDDGIAGPTTAQAGARTSEGSITA